MSSKNLSYKGVGGKIIEDSFCDINKGCVDTLGLMGSLNDLVIGS